MEDDGTIRVLAGLVPGQTTSPLLKADIHNVRRFFKALKLGLLVVRQLVHEVFGDRVSTYNAAIRWAKCLLDE